MPAPVKEEIKLLGKLLREAVKAQTARLETALVRQRRWSVARWRELNEDHPLLRSFASGIVWGVYLGEVPPVVYSETIGDLKSIVATQARAPCRFRARKSNNCFGTKSAVCRFGAKNF